MLNKILADTAKTFNVPEYTASKIVTLIDVCKMRGLTGGEAASKFADLLGFLQIADDVRSHEYFATRWTDHKVWIKIGLAEQQYLNNETPLFTQSRLEPVYNKTAFYDQGCQKVDLGVNTNPITGGSVRRPARLEESFSNFIVHEYLPDSFFLETFKTRVHGILANGLPDVPDVDAYRIYVSADTARQSLSRDLITKGVSASRASLLDYTLLELNVDKMQMNNDVFYTKTISGHKGQGSNYGYFYSADVPASGIRVSTQNIAD